MNTRLTKYLVGVSEAKAPKSFSIKLLVESNKPPAKQLTPDDAARVKNLPVGMWQRGGKVYTAAVGGEYLGQVVGNIYVPKKQADSTASSDTPSSAQDTDAQDASSRPTDASAPTLPLFKLIKSKRAMLSGLIDAILANDPQEIQKQISALELVRDSEGRLKSTRKGIEYSFFGRDAERATLALKELEALLGPLDISIPTERERTMSDASADSLKPQSIKSGTKKATPKILRGDSGSPRGFALGDAEYTVIKQSPNLKKQLIESQPYVSETFQRMGMSPEEATAEAEAVNDSIAAHNLKIRFLAQEIESNPEAFTEVTDRSVLANTLSDKIAEAAGGNLLPRQKQAIVGIFRQLAEADTTEEFDKAWAQQSTEPSVTGDEQFLLNLLLEANLPPNVIPALCESVEVLRKSVGDTKVLIPTRQNFPIADIIALRTPMSSLDSIQDAESLSEDIAKQLQLVYVQVDLVSIKSGAKKGAGRAAASQTRILLTEFDSEPTRRDLLTLVGSPAHSELWNCKDANEFAYYSNEKLSILVNYISDIIAYYELETAVESAGNDPRKQLELVFQILGRGTAPRYDNNGMYVGPGAISKMFSEESNITELNRLQLRLYSFIGFASDAIYNQRAKQQGFANVAYTASGIKETDGVGLMARSVFQFSRSPEEWKNTSGMVVYRPSYSYTSNLENTDNASEMESFSARANRGEVSELLLEKKYSEEEKARIKIPLNAISKGGNWYIGDKLDGKVVGVGDAKKYVKASPEEIAADARKKATPSAPKVKKATPSAPKVKKARNTSKAGRSKRRESVGNILSARSTHPTHKDSNGNPLEVRYIKDESGNPIDTGSEEGRKQALEVINKHIAAIQSKTIDACKTFKTSQTSKQWLGGVGELYAYKELLEAGVEAYLLPDSNPESDIVIISKDGDEKDLNIVEISVKSSLGEDVGQMGASTRAVVTKMVEGKTSNFDPELGGVSAATAINAVYDVRYILGNVVSFNAVTGTTGKRVLDLSDEQLERCTPEYQAAYRANQQTSEGPIVEIFSLFEQNRLITDKDLITYEETIMTYIEKKNKKESPEVIDEAKRLAQYYLKKLKQEVANNPRYTLADTRVFIIKNMGIVADNTNPPSDVFIESDLIGIQFDAETGVPKINMARASDVKACIDSNTKSSGTDGREKWADQLPKYLDVKWRAQHRIAKGKTRGPIEFKMNWAPEKNCTKKSWQSVKDYLG